jgi:UPF0755 protein
MKKTIVLLVIFLVVVVLGILWWQNGNLPVNKSNTETKTFVVAQGDNVRAIAYNLKAQGLIRDPIVFFLITRQQGLDKQIQAGGFRLSPSMTPYEIAENLTHGTFDIWVTIPEGYRATQIAQVLEEEMPGYDESWDEVLIQNEGYLFPDTYLFPQEATVETIVDKMRETFEQKYESIGSSSTNLSKEEIVVLASLIEREALANEERPVISGILHNRLDLGMALQVDATIQYAKGEQDGRWWRPISTADYTNPSAYNTYRIVGLPPAPISNPGLESLKAAANPASVDYLFYLHDEKRTIRYAETLAQHNRNIAEYGVSN